MAQRMFNLSKWTFLEETHMLEFPNEKARQVTIDVNSPGPVCFYVTQRDEDLHRALSLVEVADEEGGTLVSESAITEVTRPAPNSVGEVLLFVGKVDGRDTLEFYVEGAFSLFCEGGDAYVYTADGQSVATHVVAPVVFTRIADRKQRNPNLEMLEYRMRLNQRRMMAELQGEYDRRLEALKEGLESYARQRNIVTPPETVGGQPAGSGKAAAGTEPAGAASGEGSEDGGEEADSVRQSKKRGRTAPVEE